MQRLRNSFRVTAALLVMVGWSATSDAQWTTFTNPVPAFFDACLLLTNGTVACHQYNSNSWRRLTPDINGSYANGTWSSLPNMPNGNDPSFGCVNCTYAPLYFASAVLPDGRLVVVGGEYVSLVAHWTNIGFIYDPVTNAWSTQLVVPYPGGQVGDAQSVLLADGTMLLANITNARLASLNPAALTFTDRNPAGKLTRNNEEGWNILPDGRVLTVDAARASTFELYDPVTNTWGNSGATPVNLTDFGAGVGTSQEVGPSVLRPDGTLIYFSGNSLGQNAVYDTNTGTWSHTATMDFPLVSGQTYHFSVADGPASLLPNGNVLVMASPVSNTSTFNNPSHFFEFNGTSLTQVADSPHASSFASYQGRMLLLPSGEVLLAAYDQSSTQDFLLYSNGGTFQNAWRPAITTAPTQVVAGNTYSISGRLFNGFSEGASYGDDFQSATNYPLVRIKNLATGHVVYARTHNHSRMGVERVGSSEIVTTQFDTPAGLEAGPSELVVVVNGIPSVPTTINDVLPTTLTYTGQTVIANGGTATLSAVLRDNTSAPVVGRTVHFTLGTGGSAQTCNGVTNASGIATCSISPVVQPLGAGVVAAAFAGDTSYGPSSTTAATTIFELVQTGAFTVGNQSASAGASVTFWGSQWAKVNTLSGGQAPAQFKGFADGVAAQPPTCGTTWTSSPGASSPPPATVPAFIGVLVPSSITKSGSTLSGNTVRIVVVRTNPGYGPDPSQTGTGTIIAEYCH